MSTQEKNVSSADGKTTLQGVVQAINFSPKGEPDGVLLQTSDKVVQVNVPPHAWADFSQTAAEGQTIEVSVEPEPAVAKHGKGTHPAFHLVAPKPKPKPKSDDHGPGHPKPDHKPDHDHGKPAKVSGVVARLNYAHHGEANGAVLEDGDFLHLKPDGMKLVGLEVGHEVTAEGDARPKPGGGQAIEAHVVNGTKLGKGPGK